jgi:hypothetical protein
MSEEAAPAAPDAPAAEPPAEPLDPRAEKIRDELVGLLRTGLGSWEKAVDSQNRLSGLIKALGVEMAETKEFSATPVFRWTGPSDAQA